MTISRVTSAANLFKTMAASLNTSSSSSVRIFCIVMQTPQNKVGVGVPRKIEKVTKEQTPMGKIPGDPKDFFRGNSIVNC